MYRSALQTARHALPGLSTIEAPLVLRALSSSAPRANYKPKEHAGRKEDGGRDARVSSSYGFGSDPSHASKEGHKGGKVGGKASGDGSSTGKSTHTQGHGHEHVYKPSEHGGVRKDGKKDGRMK
ncbi:hypothetical protein JCM11641_001341 [Rhodosporidiobolus odoratus]